MVVLISKGDVQYMDTSSISYSLEHFNLYNIPYSVEVGVTDNSLSRMDDLEIGEEYSVFITLEKSIKLTYSHSKSAQTIQGQASTALVFVNKEIFNLLHNKYNHTNSVLGVKLTNYIGGMDNQFNIFEFELRKKGQVILTRKGKLEVSTVSDLTDEKPKYITSISNTKKIEKRPLKQNYSTVIKNTIQTDNHLQSKNGKTFGEFIPWLNKAEIRALSNFFIPKIIAESESANRDILIGDLVSYKGKKYVIIEIQKFSFRSRILNIYILGVQSGI